MIGQICLTNIIAEMKKLIRCAALFVAACAFAFTGCSNQTNTDEAPYIISLTVNNGGLAGTERYTGVVDTTARTVVFNDVAAETDLAAVTFEARLSIGAKLDKSSYDFITGNDPDAKVVEQNISVVPEFGDPVSYKVTLNIKGAETAPVLNRLVVKDAAGAEHSLTLTNNVIDGIVLLGIPESPTAEIVSVTILPARASYEFTAISENTISASNPGKLRLSFMGLSTEYAISFSASPAAGADFTKAKVHAWDTNTSVYLDLADQNTRSGDMDENYILLVNRAGDTPNPYLLNVSDVLSDNVNNKIQLDVTGIEGGTFYVSSGRLTQGHIYVCNLQTPVGEEAPLKVYHWESPSAKPEVVLEWYGELDNAEDPFALRLGDNMGLSLDASGNGYAFFAGQETGTERLIRFTVTGFKTFSEPTVLLLKSPAQYYGIYNKVGENEYLYKATFNPTLWLYDKDATLLYELALEGGADAGHATDFHIIEYNRARYLICTNARRYNWWSPEALLVYDISEGLTNAAALKALDESRPIDPESEDPEFPDFLPFEPTYKYEYSSGDQPVDACSAICNAVVKDGKLVLLSAAPTAGLVVVEVPMAQ